jgi:hypothetical protein
MSNMRLVVHVVALCSAALLFSDCATTCEHASCCIPGGSPLIESPFRLEVQVQPQRVAPGTNVTVVYTLINTSDQPIASCAFGWDNFQLLDSTGADHSQLMGMSSAWPCSTDPIRLPPGAALTWQEKMVLPRGAPGPAQFRGVFQSREGSWVGTSRSEPVALEILSE